jgi:hypothetical protein
MNKGEKKVVVIEAELKGNARRSRTKEQCKRVKNLKIA